MFTLRASARVMRNALSMGGALRILQLNRGVVASGSGSEDKKTYRQALSGGWHGPRLNRDNNGRRFRRKTERQRKGEVYED